MYEIIEKYFIAILGGILTLSFGGYVAYRVNKKTRVAEAGKYLIKSFDIAISHINKYDGQFYLLENILRSEFEKQRVAIREFRRHIDPITTIRFNCACHNYYGKYDDSPDFRQYILSKDMQRTLIERINAIIKFAQKS